MLLNFDVGEDNGDFFRVRLKIYEEVRSPWHLIIKTVSYVTVHVVRLRLAALGTVELFNTVYDRDKFMEKVKINSNVQFFSKLN